MERINNEIRIRILDQMHHEFILANLLKKELTPEIEASIVKEREIITDLKAEVAKIERDRMIFEPRPRQQSPYLMSPPPVMFAPRK
jgi:hypothetical protein